MPKIFIIYSLYCSLIYSLFIILFTYYYGNTETEYIRLFTNDL